MPRPALKEERRKQIMEAFERCVARYGVEGATLERIAEEAGLARALIRHNVGNRDDLIEAMIERHFRRSGKQWESLIKALPDSNRSRTLVEHLFDPSYGDAQMVLITEALIASAAQDKSLAKQLHDWINMSLDLIRDVIHEEFPQAENEKVEAAAAGILGIYFNVDSFALLGDMARLRAASRNAALSLIDRLE